MKQPYDIVQVLYGSETFYKNCPGWCRYHHIHLTKNQILRKNCLDKQCKCLDKILTHKWWAEREQKKKLKKGGKNETAN